MLSFSIVRWSVVDLPSLPPACASDIFICGRVRLSIIRSYTFPMLLDTVIPHGTDSKRVLGVPKHSGGAARNSVGAKYSNG